MIVLSYLAPYFGAFTLFVTILGSLYILVFRVKLSAYFEGRKLKQKILDEIRNIACVNVRPPDKFSRPIAISRLSDIANLNRRELPIKIIKMIEGLASNQDESWINLEKEAASELQKSRSLLRIFIPS